MPHLLQKLLGRIWIIDLIQHAEPFHSCHGFRIFTSQIGDHLYCFRIQTVKGSNRFLNGFLFDRQSHDFNLLQVIIGTGHLFDQHLIIFFPVLVQVIVLHLHQYLFLEFYDIHIFVPDRDFNFDSFSKG